MMFNRDDEHEVVYGDAFMRHLTQIWNLRISYPIEELYLFDDDIKGASVTQSITLMLQVLSPFLSRTIL